MNASTNLGAERGVNTSALALSPPSKIRRGTSELNGEYARSKVIHVDIPHVDGDIVFVGKRVRDGVDPGVLFQDAAGHLV